jgi:nucleotide-binding universal stress UspA family protein
VAHFHRNPVLVPTDFSQASLRAVHVARSIAESDSDVTVVYVTHDYDLLAPAHTWGSDALPDNHEQQQSERLRQWANDNDFGDVNLRIRTGDPGTQVCQLAEELSCRLIVVPSHGRHGMSRILLGSVTERIVRHCDCSVLVLRHEPHDGSVLALPEHWLPRKRVVAPIDFSPSAPTTIETAIEVTEDRADVDVMNVVPSFNDPILIGSTVLTDEDRRANRQEQLERYLVEHEYSGTQGHAVTGDPGMMIVQHAADVRADLIVMPSHGYHGLRRLVLGSTTERVLRHSGSPVLVLRRHDAD